MPLPNMLVFQVDLFSASGPVPATLSDVSEREKDIRYSSRTRLNTDVFRRNQELRRAAQRLVALLPDDLKDNPDAVAIRGLSNDAAVTIVHLIHRRKNYFTQSKDFEFSRQSIKEHWESGAADVRRTFRNKSWRNRKRPETGVSIFDLTHDAMD